MNFRLEQLPDSVDLGLLLLDLRVGSSIGGEFRRGVELFGAPIALPRSVHLGVSRPCAIQAPENDRRRWTQIAQRLEREVRRDIPPRLERSISALKVLGVSAAKTGVRWHGPRSRLPISWLSDRTFGFVD